MEDSSSITIPIKVYNRFVRNEVLLSVIIRMTEGKNNSLISREEIMRIIGSKNGDVEIPKFEKEG